MYFFWGGVGGVGGWGVIDGTLFTLVLGPKDNLYF